ncbi:bifunctional biotin--[acetyl-CoA-carboxylase] ligase/biotin operon repressor BirA [Microbulbifer thermotolerans]|uniref:bifunctional biotin--[acetyl-CoA-carboxylase] ligase/biotin operon repressor BirA n=1 Tax=Microbulbifer thermotolerans TaxID=252514 RepID=UPI00224AA45E|nr:bifunctional biotin--[acetyl-CoA-carboxylase] ligase/biotin operon repressor BirA [Microbulbifer thermotolerans]MCX2836392.1 bifunctional biotin--[acetyl-CoA-carboxylase] ligase/biotin operon repressor BirA [Microbulbifer thermotolerans]
MANSNLKTPLQQLRPVLNLLADGEVHSGESLGAALGVSRAAVWKQLQKLTHYGLSLESVKGRGYRLPGGLDLLSPEAIEAGLDSAARNLLRELLVRDEVDSTNARLLARLEENRGHGVAMFAERQTAGRGRRGRSWISPFGGGITLSVGWQFSGGVQQLEGLSLAVGVALARALGEFNVPDVRLKWPNDVWCRGRKLAGVLLELSGDLTDRCAVVVGVGLNVGLRAENIEAIDQPWIDLNSVCPGVDRNRLAAVMLNHLLPLLHTYPERGFAAYRNEWLALDQFAGQPVRLVSASRDWCGTAAGVDETGALVLEVDGERRSFHGGEVSLRRERHDT